MLLKLQQYQWWRRLMGGDWYCIRGWGLEMFGGGVWVQQKPPEDNAIVITDEEHYGRV